MVYKFLIGAGLVGILSGCASSALTGDKVSAGAVYHYKHINKDGSVTELNTTSTRDFGDFTLEIGKDGTVKAKVETVDSSKVADKALNITSKLLEKVAP